MRGAGPFRPLQPLGEEDRGILVGRERELEALASRLFDGNGASAWLVGPSGIGKTSLLRAGLLPLLKGKGVPFVYADLARVAGPIVPPPPGTRLLVLDDVGALLDEPARLAELAALGRARAARGLSVLVSIDDGDLRQIDALLRLEELAGPPRADVRLGGFDARGATDLLERTLLEGSAYFEPGLSARVAEDAAARGEASPSLLHVVAATMLADGRTSERKYTGAGGVDAIVGRFFARACVAAGGAKAERVLATVAWRGPRSVVHDGELARAIGGDVDEVAAHAIAADLSRTNLLRSIAATTWCLTSEWSRQPAMGFTGVTHARGGAARRLLRAHLERGRMLSPRAIVEVRRHAGALEPDETQLVRRSLRVLLVGLAVLVGAPLVGWAIAYGVDASRAHLDVRGDGPSGEVVLRLGRPRAVSLPHDPPFGSVVVDTGFARSSLAKPLPEGAVARSGDAWMAALADALGPRERAILGLLRHDPSSLAAAWADPSLRPTLLAVIAALGDGSTPEQSALQSALADADEAMRARAVSTAAALAPRAGALGTTIVQRLAATLSADASALVRARVLDEAERMADVASPTFAGRGNATYVMAAGALAPDAATRRRAVEWLATSAASDGAAALALVTALRGPGAHELSERIDRLLAAGSPIEQALAAVVLDGKRPEELRVAALDKLAARDALPAAVEQALPTLAAGDGALALFALPLFARARPADADAPVRALLKGSVAQRAAAARSFAYLPKTPDTPKVMKALVEDRAPEVRAAAIHALPGALGRDAAALLAKMAKQGRADAQRAAIDTLATSATRLGAGTASAALYAVAAKGAPPLRRAAIEALGRVAATGKGGTGALVTLTRDKEPAARAAAATALGDALAGGDRDVPAALKALARDGDASVRRAAAAALGRAPSEKGVASRLAPRTAKALDGFLDDEDASVRAASVTAIAGWIGALSGDDAAAAIAPLLADKDAAVRAAARAAAMRIGPEPAFQRPLAQSLAGDLSVDERAAIAAAAPRLGSVDAARLALADPEARVRLAVVAGSSALAKAAAPLLAPLLDDADPAVRRSVVDALVAARGLAPLLAAAQRAESPSLRALALPALGQVARGSEAGKSALVAALSDGDPAIRAAAATGLGHLAADDDAARAALEGALGDAARDVRSAVVVALGDAWAAHPSDAVAAHLRDDRDAEARYAAALALAHGRPTAALAASIDALAQGASPTTQLAVALARATLGRPADLAALLHALRE